MPIYEVTVRRTECGALHVEADSPEEAQTIALEEIQNMEPDCIDYQVDDVAEIVAPDDLAAIDHEVIRSE